jgi:hypothetical protein
MFPAECVVSAADVHDPQSVHASRYGCGTETISPERGDRDQRTPGAQCAITPVPRNRAPYAQTATPNASAAMDA